MDKNLKDILTNLSPDQFAELAHAISLGLNTREKMKTHQITIPMLAERTKLDEETIFNFLCGALDFDFKTITIVELALEELIDSKNGKLTLSEILKGETKK